MNIEILNIEIVETLIRAFGYLLGLVGILLVYISFGFSIKNSIYRFRISNKIKSQNFETDLRKKPILKWYDKLLNSTILQYRPIYFVRILSIQSIVFVAMCAIFGLVTKSFLFTISSSITFAFLMPIGILYIKLVKIRNQTQENLADITVKFEQLYSKNNSHTIYALKELVEQLEGKSKMVFGMLLVRLQGNVYMRKEATEIFAYQLGGTSTASWGTNLSINILRSIEDGINIRTSLQDLSKDMIENNKRIRDDKTEGKEIIQLGKLPIVGIPVILALNIYFQNTLGGDALYYHFVHPLGVKVLSISIILALMGFGLAKLYDKPKKNI